MYQPIPFAAAPERQDDESLARMVLEYQFLRRQLIEMHSAEPSNVAAIDALMRKLDETRVAVRAAQSPRAVPVSARR